MSLSKNQYKLITSLQQKKYRQKHQLFVAEGIKVVNELLESTLTLEKVFVVEGYEVGNIDANKVVVISESDLKRISSLKTPNKLLALFKIPDSFLPVQEGFSVALDAVNDPGNLGTIIRLCDWFGVTQLLCSKNTVDCYNQKVIQSTMGSITRVTISYIDLEAFIKNTELPVFSADMDGENIYTADLPKNGVLVMGNEANGISSEINTLVKNKVTIPRFGKTQKTESLNVATATAILLSEFKRRY